MIKNELRTKIRRLCDLNLYDLANQFANTIQLSEQAIEAQLLCIAHERRSKLDNKPNAYRVYNMYDKDFTHDIEARKKRWLQENKQLPKEIYVIEFYGTGDPYFGGAADDRELTIHGSIWDGNYPKPDAMVFTSIEDAAKVALTINNRRPNSILGLIPYFDW